MSEIKTKYCGYNCGTKIYWNTNENMYVELMSKKKHICPNRSKYPKSTTSTTTSSKTTTAIATAPKQQQQPQQQQDNKPKMANSFEILEGSPRFVRGQYEFLSELIRNAGGKVHGSQRGVNSEMKINIIVYYEVPELTKLGIQDVFSKFVANHGEGKKIE